MKDASPHGWQRAIVALVYLAGAAGIVACLYWAQAVLVPLALAMFLTLVLAPPVGWLERLRVPRAPAVLLVVLLSGVSVAGVGWVFTRQFVGLAAELPAYGENIKAKIRSLKELATAPAAGRMGRLIEDVSRELQVPSSPSNTELAASGKDSPQVNPRSSQATQTIVVDSGLGELLSHVVRALGSVTELLVSLALAVVLGAFMLLNRESLRDRIIRLIGDGRLTATTRAFDEAMQRISRFLFAQFVVNATYGVALAAGLMVLGVEYALMWGMLAALLRYVPYLGTWIAAIGPVLLSVVMSTGWTQPLLVIGWILVIELVSSNIAEPLLFGQSMGVSEVGLLAAAAFWAFLWGPIGLVLSSPLTVCLVVLGRYVPQLKFIDVLLGDQPALAPHVTLYQRLLAGDRDEAARIAGEHARTYGVASALDNLLVPALSFVKRDRHLDELTQEDVETILGAVAEIARELREPRAAASSGPESALNHAPPRLASAAPALIACAIPDKTDYTALEMLCLLPALAKWQVRVASDDMLAAELVTEAIDRHAEAVCIAVLPPGGLAHARYLCKRFRSSLPNVKIVVGRWMPGRRCGDATVERLIEAGADSVETTLSATARRLAAWWPAASRAVEANPAGLPKPAGATSREV